MMITSALAGGTAYAQEAQEEAQRMPAPNAAQIRTLQTQRTNPNNYTLELASSITAQELATAPFRYYVPAGARANGAFGSFWVTDLFGRNPNDNTANYTITAHPRGQVASASDPSMPPVSLQGRASVDYPDVVSRIKNTDGSTYTGAAWLEIQSDQPLTFEVSPTYNLATTGEHTGSTMPVFDAATLNTDQRFAHEGDRIEYRLLGRAANMRENYINFVPPESDDVTMQLELLDRLGNRKAYTTFDIPAGSYQQDTIENIMGTTVEQGDTLLATPTRKGTGTKELLTYGIISQIQTLNPNFQDSAILEGKKYALLETGNYTTLPANAEVNDPINTSVIVKTRSGAIVESIAYDIDGDGNQDGGAHPGNGTNSYTEFSTAIAGAPFSTTKPQIRANITENGHNYYRWIQGTPWTVNAEKNGYTANYADAKAFIMGNLETVARWSSHASYGGSVYTPETWKAAWQSWFDGVSNPPNNPEIDYLTFNDTGNQYNTGNILLIKLKDGTTTGMSSFPEQEFDQFRTAVKAKLPQ